MMDRAEAIKWLEGDRDRAKYQEKIFEESFSTPQENPYTPIVEIYDMAIAALREQERRQWKSSATPPKDKGLYLAYISSRYGGYEKIACYTPCYDGFEDHLRGRAIWYDRDSEWGDYEISDITHWRYLPEPPKEGAER